MYEELKDLDIEALEQQLERLKARGSVLEQKMREERMNQLRIQIKAHGEEPCR